MCVNTSADCEVSPHLLIRNCWGGGSLLTIISLITVLQILTAANDPSVFTITEKTLTMPFSSLRDGQLNESMPTNNSRHFHPGEQTAFSVIAKTDGSFAAVVMDVPLD